MPDEPRTIPDGLAIEQDIGAGSNEVARVDPTNYFWLSVLLPGAGQIAQRRFVAAAVQIATVGSYLVGATSVGGDNALWLALAWNMWSAVDAYWYARAE